MRIETYREMIRMGGCINNASPYEERTDQCRCYKITFSLCYRFKMYDVTMCREWVRYMASASRKEDGLHPTYRPTWGGIIVEQVHKFFPGMVPYMKMSKPSGMVGKKLCGSYQYYPTAFREVVMSNKWGHISHYISTKSILTDFPESIHYGIGLYLSEYNPTLRNPDARRRGMTIERNNYYAVDYNTREFKRFQLALWRIYSSRESKFPQPVMHDMDSCIKFAQRLLKLKIEDHATSEQQVPATLPV